MPSVAFDDELREYLEEVERGGRLRPARHRAVDPQRLRQHFLRRLRGVSETAASRHHAYWSDRLASLAAFVEQLPAGAAPTGAEDAQRLANQLIDAAVDKVIAGQ